MSDAEVGKEEIDITTSKAVIRPDTARCSIHQALKDVLKTLDLVEDDPEIERLTKNIVIDNIARISIWAGEMGADYPQDDTRSADHKLKSHPMVAELILERLSNIEEDNQALLAIARGESRDTSQVHSPNEDELTALDEIIALDSGGGLNTEADVIASTVSDSISSLFRLTALLRQSIESQVMVNAAARSSSLPATSAHDFNLVLETFPKLDYHPALLDALSRAATQRQTLLRDAQRTTSNIQLSEVVDDDDDAYSDTTSEGSQRLLTMKHVRLERLFLKEALKNELPFECPYCRQTVAFKRNVSWR